MRDQSALKSNLHVYKEVGGNENIPCKHVCGYMTVVRVVQEPLLVWMDTEPWSRAKTFIQVSGGQQFVVSFTAGSVSKLKKRIKWKRQRKG